MRASKKKEKERKVIAKRNNHEGSGEEFIGAVNNDVRSVYSVNYLSIGYATHAAHVNK